MDTVDKDTNDPTPDVGRRTSLNIVWLGERQPKERE